MVFRFLLFLSLFVAHLLLWEDSTESAQYLQRLTETQNFSLGRPTHVKPTADGKSVIFLRAISAQDRTNALYEFNTVTRETSVLVTPDELLQGATEHLSIEERSRRERSRTTAGGITALNLGGESW